MEMFALVFSVPGAFVASLIYRFCMLYVARWTWVKYAFLAGSAIVLAGIVAEWLLLVVRGPVGARLLVGPQYFSIHSFLFLLGTPALINALVLPDPEGPRARAALVLPLATALAFVLLLLEYIVSDALFGIDGVGGPFSTDL